MRTFETERSVTEGSWQAYRGYVRTQLRLLDNEPSNEHLDELIWEAFAILEDRTGLGLAPQTNTYRIPQFPAEGSEIVIVGLYSGFTSLSYRPTGASVDTSYDDAQTLKYVVGKYKELHITGVTGLAGDSNWPADRKYGTAITLQIARGAAQLPKPIKSALALQVRQAWDGQDYTRRIAIDRLLRPWQQWR